ncbi:ThiF family adenylyltransferase [Desulfobaculum bizertense]|uniref:HesA/MoeB/ThiF family protein n=1 Tax=Desulfobaculum bizertense TaxID=376490 RepID=UPI001F38B777|nr:ThiF family adenylyltransferase [Desulfobaculum bizertense]UIJ37514.1 ThiF family adenylyltransferase [Desulfobaculum bizertense]
MGSIDLLGTQARQLGVPSKMADGTEYLSLSMFIAEEISSRENAPLREVELAALAAGVIPEHYVRNFNSIDIQGQINLLSSKLALVGLGGLGGLLIETFARMGVGHIEAADGDSFEESNLNRQLLSSSQRIRLSKARSASLRVVTINPAIDCAAHAEFVTEDSLRAMCHGASVLVDALGGLDNRQLLQDVATEFNIPLVTAGMAGFSGYVATVLPGQPGPASFFGSGSAAEDSLGTPAPAVYTAASLQAAEVMRILAGQAPALDNRMLLFDLNDMSFEKIQIA